MILNYFNKTKLSALITIAFFRCLNCSVTAQSRLYLATDDHTDFMWTATDTAYTTLFINMIDAWMANNNASNGNQPDYQTKFNCDGTYWAWVYQKNKTRHNSKISSTR